MAKAVERYRFYLSSLSTYYNVTPEKLSPKLFDQKKDLSELLLISHVYWDLAKAYDRAPSLQKEFRHCLDQFVLFTQGYKYQHVNARLLKRFVRKKIPHHPQAFKDTLERIQVDSKGCFVASFAYGEDHPTTQTLREFKSMIVPFRAGLFFVDFYYTTCPYALAFFKKHPRLYRFIFWTFLHPVCLFTASSTKIIRSCLSLKN